MVEVTVTTGCSATSVISVRVVIMALFPAARTPSTWVSADRTSPATMGRVNENCSEPWTTFEKSMPESGIGDVGGLRFLRDDHGEGGRSDDVAVAQ
jgi:hypothetical protein